MNFTFTLIAFALLFSIVESVRQERPQTGGSLSNFLDGNNLKNLLAKSKEGNSELTLDKIANLMKKLNITLPPVSDKSSSVDAVLNEIKSIEKSEKAKQ
uniref:Uncharacterized protein n=1 Tax=Caenorhabditis japonica TaxID=281687 RepID=A0A8R1IB93_CAEJA